MNLRYGKVWRGFGRKVELEKAALGRVVARTKKYRPLKLEASVSGFHGVELIDQLLELTGRYLPPKVRINWMAEGPSKMMKSVGNKNTASGKSIFTAAF